MPLLSLSTSNLTLLSFSPESRTVAPANGELSIKSSNFPLTLCAFTEIVKGRKKADNVTAWLVPGSHVVEAQIKEEGLLDILTEAGFVLRQPGCSACLAMNDDKVPAGKYAVSLYNKLGQKLFSTVVTHEGSNSSQQVDMKSVLAAGTYSLQVQGLGNSKANFVTELIAK